MTGKHVPLRKCVGCGEMKEKRELLRIVKAPDGGISADRTGKMPGRGAYLCASLTCLQSARKARRLEKAFSCRIPDEVYDRLEEEWQNHD